MEFEEQQWSESAQMVVCSELLVMGISTEVGRVCSKNRLEDVYRYPTDHNGMSLVY
jgi:hypothetical protein